VVAPWWLLAVWCANRMSDPDFTDLGNRWRDAVQRVVNVQARADRAGKDMHVSLLVEFLQESGTAGDKLADVCVEFIEALIARGYAQRTGQ
jgi:hypothetical protein